MSTILNYSREARAHARRFVSHITNFAQPASPELIHLWEMVGRSDLSPVRARVDEMVGALVDHAELNASDIRLLMGFSYLRLRYLLDVQGAGKDIETLLLDPDRMQRRLDTAFSAIEPDLLSALTPASRNTLRNPWMQQTFTDGFQHLINLSKRSIELAEAVSVRPSLLPADLHEPSSTALTLATLVIVNLWPNKTNTPDPKFPGGGGQDGGAPKPQ